MTDDNRTALDKQVAEKTAAQSLSDHATSLDLAGQSWTLPHAWFHEVSVNGLGFDQRQSETIPGQPSLDDPIESRRGAFANPLGRDKWYISKDSFDVLRWSQSAIHRTEVAFLKAAIDELFDGDNRPLPLMAWFMTRDTTGSSDSDQQPVMIWSRDGIRFLAPVHFEGGVVGMPSSGGPAQQLWDGTGKYFAQMQNDGNDAAGNPVFNFVAYRASTPFSIGNPEAALFSVNDILARLTALEARR